MHVILASVQWNGSVQIQLQFAIDRVQLAWKKYVSRWYKPEAFITSAEVYIF